MPSFDVILFISRDANNEGMNPQITLWRAHGQFATRGHALFCMNSMVTNKLISQRMQCQTFLHTPIIESECGIAYHIDAFIWHLVLLELCISMIGMPFVRESVVPHLTATLSERCTGEWRALTTRRCSPQCLFYWGGRWSKWYSRLYSKKIPQKINFPSWSYN